MLGYPAVVRPIPRRLLPPASLIGWCIIAGWMTGAAWRSAGLLDPEEGRLEHETGSGATEGAFLNAGLAGGLEDVVIEDRATAGTRLLRSEPECTEGFRCIKVAIDVCVFPGACTAGVGRIFSDVGLAVGLMVEVVTGVSILGTSLDGDNGL